MLIAHKDVSEMIPRWSYMKLELEINLVFHDTMLKYIYYPNNMFTLKVML